ncbi:uncharacterized protein BX663DRAFT_527493 [Cokeromyces recurvatus]|uniref:uncharacterized protein n=1 Tax=Cokeromyces recurvatus TaxID=90255 RepID=UPI00222122E9|nr:uncharacterized protein BX663DRAFT_527493 [Cokeromyces recurvatus]KAI7897658.1 hypothetical protein BX663DRAFT_527493 [Cokeromyces recurvatus]
MYIFLFPLFLCFLIRHVLSLDIILNKRQAIASRKCGNENNTISICTPTFDSIWKNDTDQEITWKWNNPTLIAYDKLDLYLLYQPTEGSYQVVKNWTGLERTKGILVQHIDDSWYPSPPITNNVSWTMYFYIVGSEYDIQQDLSLIPTYHNYFSVPQSFILIQPAYVDTTTTTTTTTNTTTNNSSTDIPSPSPTSERHSDSFPSWAIAVICIVAVIFLIIAIIIILWVLKRQQRHRNRTKSHDEKRPVLLASTHESSLAIPVMSTTTPSPTYTEKNRNTPSSPLGMHKEGQQSSSILSSTDALMIADTFRQFMRKPEWNDNINKEEEKSSNL